MIAPYYSHAFPSPSRMAEAPYASQVSMAMCLITSQIDTAPKLSVNRAGAALRLITSQIDTAPKLMHLTELELWV